MTIVTATRRRFRVLPSIAMCVMLLFSGVVGALHHHGESTAGHACAVCNASHAPAVPTVAAAGSTTPALLPGRVDARRRAPPLA